MLDLRPLPGPNLTALRRDLEQYLNDYNTDRAHTGRLTKGRITADIAYSARKMGAPARWEPDHDNLSRLLRIRAA
jgi:hypothetical protein